MDVSLRNARKFQTSFGLHYFVISPGDFISYCLNVFLCIFYLHLLNTLVSLALSTLIVTSSFYFSFLIIEFFIPSK